MLIFFKCLAFYVNNRYGHQMFVNKDESSIGAVYLKKKEFIEVKGFIIYNGYNGNNYSMTRCNTES